MDKDKELLSLKEENIKLKENLKKITEESVQQLSRIQKLEEEIEQLKEENQKLRLELCLYNYSIGYYFFNLRHIYLSLP